MAKDVTAIINDLEDFKSEKEALEAKVKFYNKLFDQYIKEEFGTGKRDLQKELERARKKASDFEDLITGYFSLDTTEKKDKFLDILCSNKGIDFIRQNTPAGD